MDFSDTGNTPEKLSFQIYIKYGILCTNCGLEGGSWASYICPSWTFLDIFWFPQEYSGQHLLDTRHFQDIPTSLKNARKNVTVLIFICYFSIGCLSKNRSEAFLPKQMETFPKMIVICQAVFIFRQSIQHFIFDDDHF